MPNRHFIYSQLVDAIESQKPCILASVINTKNSTSATVGDKALVDVDGGLSGWIGGGCCQAVVKKVAPQLLKENKHCVIRVCPEHDFVDDIQCYPSHCPSEGTVDIFLEPIANQQAVHLYGNTPIAQSIARFSEELGINLKWRQSPEQLPQNLSNSRADVAIIATQGQGVIAALQQVLADKIEHILLIASSKKAQALKDKLREMGECENAVNKVTAPAGINIGANSGAEIALSVMAKVVSLRCSKQSSVNEKGSCTKDELSKNTQQNQKLPSTSSSNCCGGS